MKFYYNGELVRTSKNHVYTHAVINMDSGKLIGCRSNKESAESEITTAIHGREQQIRNAESKLKAIEQGKKMYKCIEGRRSYYLPVNASDKEGTEEWIESSKRSIEYIKKNWKVVELEVR